MYQVKSFTSETEANEWLQSNTSIEVVQLTSSVQSPYQFAILYKSSDVQTNYQVKTLMDEGEANAWFTDNQDKEIQQITNARNDFHWWFTVLYKMPAA